MSHSLTNLKTNVEFINTIYAKSLEENERNIIFWEKYLQNLEALDLNAFSDKLTVPVLVPIGSRVLFRGELRHTNEVTVALGADYFVKCSVNQAQVLQQHRIKDARSKLEMYKKERSYLQNQIQITKNTACEDAGYDIIEVVTDEEDKKWREQHRENVRQYKQRKGRDDEEPGNEKNEDELWDRLDELELKEDLKNELGLDHKIAKAANQESGTDSDDDEDDEDDDDDDNNTGFPYNGDMCDAKVVNEAYLAQCRTRRKIFPQPSKLQLFERVVERHNVLKEMIAELRGKQRICRTEEDMAERLDDMEKLEELEDEMAILEDMLASDEDDDDIEEPEEGVNSDDPPKKSVVFADDESETFELTFKHSEVEPSNAPYDPQNGITKPSDIYKAFAINFNAETTSILKKTKYSSPSKEKHKVQVPSISKEKQDVEVKHEVREDSNSNTIIALADVIEKVDVKEKNVNHNERPMSLFKKRRQQLKE